jgi:hypothetical protein
METAAQAKVQMVGSTGFFYLLCSQSINEIINLIFCSLQQNTRENKELQVGDHSIQNVYQV